MWWIFRFVSFYLVFIFLFMFKITSILYIYFVFYMVSST